MRGISVGGLAACLAVAVSWGGPAYALDPVIQKMKGAKSVRFTITQTLGDQKPVPMLYRIAGDHSRIEAADGATVIVTDHKKRQGLVTIPALKQYQRLPRPGAQLAAGDGKSPLDSFLSIRDAKAERLGKEKVGDVTADKLKVAVPAAGGDPAREWTLWLDPATTLPVKMTLTSTTLAGDKRVAVEGVFTDFAWNEPFADDLFALDPPAGFTDGTPGRKPSAERTHPVSLLVALDNQQKAKSFRAVVNMTLPDGKTRTNKLFGSGSKIRIEQGDGQTVVGDGESGKLVMLDPKAKVARVAETGLPKGAGGHPEVAEAVRKVLANEGAEDLGESFLDGRKVRQYRAKGVPLGDQKTDITYWVDAKRQVPVRYEMTTTAGPQPIATVIDYLGFDEELDPKLFDLGVPDGYTREELKLTQPAKK